MDKLKVEESDWTLFEIPLESPPSEEEREKVLYEILSFCKDTLKMWEVHYDRYRGYSHLDDIVDGVSRYFHGYKKHSGLCLMVWAYSREEAKDRAVKFCKDFNKWKTKKVKKKK
jgi:hypothetical protein